MGIYNIEDIKFADSAKGSNLPAFDIALKPGEDDMAVAQDIVSGRRPVAKPTGGKIVPISQVKFAPERRGMLDKLSFLQGGGAELETLGDPANAEAAKAVIQAIPTLATGAVSWIPAGLSMFSFDRRGLTERAKTAADIQEALTIKAPSKLAEDVVRGVAYPLELAAKGGEKAGEWLEEKGYPLAGAVARTAGEAAPFIIPGIPKAFKEIKRSSWYREMTIKERALVDPYIENMAADIASGDLTTAEIRELWKDPANRETLLKRYQGVGEEATGNVKPAGEPMRASGADVVGELPAGQGFELRPTQAEIRDLLATMAEEGPKALPAGQGFELRPTEAEAREILTAGQPKTPALPPTPEGTGEGFYSHPGEPEAPILTKKGTPFLTKQKANAAIGWNKLDRNLYEVSPVEGGYAITRKTGREFRPGTEGVEGAKTEGAPDSQRAPEGMGQAAKLTKPLSNQRGSIDIGPMVEGIKGASAEVKKIASDIRKGADDYLGAISTRLYNIHPSLKFKLRDFEFSAGDKKIEYMNRVLPYMKKTSGVSAADREAYDLARKNGNPQALKHFVNKYNMGKEYHDLRVLLKQLYEEAKAVGYEMGYRPNFHPRVLKDPEGFLQYWYKQKDWPVMDRAIKAKEASLGRDLTTEERAQLINTMLRGYRVENIGLSTPGQLKARTVEHVNTELNKYYMDSDAALAKYISDMVDAIEARKLFGKGEQGKVSIQSSIGGYVDRLLKEGKIKPENERELRDILSARFNEVGTHGLVGLYKNASYIDTMGSPISAVTQIGDLAWALYKNGVVETATATAKAIVNKSTLKKENVGVGKIASEFADMGKAARAVDKTFQLIGLNKIDNIGKEALINATLSKARKMSAKDPTALAKELEPIFEGETAQVIADLKAGKITDNVRLYLFNVLADFQPIALSEMPMKYLAAGNGRVFYMLKTFTLKQFDAFRREAFQKIATEGTRAEGIKNLTKLAGCFVAANATADIIKDFILGRPINLDDTIVDNLFRLAGVNKFVTWQARREGVRSAVVKQVAPPFKLGDAVIKDIQTWGDKKGFESAQSVPLVGKLYYWWFGRGVEKKKQQVKRNAKGKEGEGLW